MPNSKHFLIMAGGTGGHVIPGLSVAYELMSRGHSVSWMGTQAGIEAELVPNAGIDIDYIQISGVRGKGIIGLLLAPFRIIKAISQALSIVKVRKPAAILGMGGFAAGPGGVAAKIQAIPLLIHEQNARAGTTNKILSKMANKVLQAFPGAFAGAEVVGNPVRGEVKLTVNAASDQKLNVLVLGGSLGALAINQIIPELYKTLDEVVNVWHQTGKRHIESVKSDYQGKNLIGENCRVSAFIDDMAEAYQWADLVICRAGAMTVSEVACASKPAIFVPFPFAIDDHQTANAMWMVDAGAAVLLPQNEMKLDVLVELVQGFSQDRNRLQKMAEAAMGIRIMDASEKVADYCEELSL